MSGAIKTATTRPRRPRTDAEIAEPEAPQEDTATDTIPSWDVYNQSVLADAVERVRYLLRFHIARVTGNSPPDAPELSRLPRGNTRLVAALDQLQNVFSLTGFERDLLILSAATELDAGFPALCGEAQGDPQRGFPTFSLALSAFPEASWGSLAPIAPLRRFRLIDFAGGAAHGSPNLTTPLRIDERILYFLLGVDYLDERLRPLLEPVSASPAPILPSRDAVITRIITTLTSSTTGANQRLPIIQLYGMETASKREVAAVACARLGIPLYAMGSGVLPQTPADLHLILSIWEREFALSGPALLLECDYLDKNERARMEMVSLLSERAHGIVFLSNAERIRPRQRTVITFEVDRPTLTEQHALWQQEVAIDAPTIRNLTAQFSLEAREIETARLTAESERAARSESDTEIPLADSLWNACRMQARSHLEDLEIVQRLDATRTRWEDLILPTDQQQTLTEIAAQVRRRGVVYQEWGFGGVANRGMGIVCLFAGPSGTGKTTAAEAIANVLSLDLYRIDLSSTISKYIGETEKNLSRVFDAAEAGGAILLFDEADALFGKRSEVGDSHDRYANIEVSYLLQRMEAYRGLAILTTNMRSALDQAFIRRIRFMVNFPFPGAAERQIIWQRVFPPETPTEGLDPARLAQLIVTGGSIRNIALNAAFLAAEEETPIQMHHILRAAEHEYGKMEKQLTSAEVAGWLSTE